MLTLTLILTLLILLMDLIDDSAYVIPWICKRLG